MECAYCRSEIEKDSLFCRHCGERIRPISEPGPSSSTDVLGDILRNFKRDVVEINAALSKTATILTTPGEAIAACQRILELRPSHETARFVLELYRTKEAQRCVASGNCEFLKSTTRDVADLDMKPASAALPNGLPACGRITSPDKRARAIALVEKAREQAAKSLAQILTRADRYAQKALVGGKTLARQKRMTFFDFYAEAEVYWSLYDAGDLAKARTGFEQLLLLNPYDSYSRNVLGSMLANQGNWAEALPQFLFGLREKPGDAHLSANLLEALIRLGQHAPATEIASHYLRHAQGPKPPTADVIEGLGRIAAMYTGALAAAEVGCTAAELSDSATDVVSEARHQDRPWLLAPTPSEEEAPLRIFISYRRADSMPIATKIATTFADDAAFCVFRDEEGIMCGENFADKIAREIRRANLILFVVSGESGIARLRKPHDQVRRELLHAVEHRIPILPLLTDGRRMPSASELPGPLRGLAEINAAQLRPSTIDDDILRLKWKIMHVAAIARMQEVKRAGEDGPEDDNRDSESTAGETLYDLIYDPIADPEKRGKAADVIVEVMGYSRETAQFLVARGEMPFIGITFDQMRRLEKGMHKCKIFGNTSRVHRN